jgi:hypothetical protein
LDHGVDELFLELHGRKITECRVQSPRVVYLVNEARKFRDHVGMSSIVTEIGEYRRASQPRALAEPDMNLSIHPAPIIQPQIPSSSERTVGACGVLAHATISSWPSRGRGIFCICERPAVR